MPKTKLTDVQKLNVFKSCLYIWLNSPQYREYNQHTNIDYYYQYNFYDNIWKSIESVIGKVSKTIRFACVVMTYSNSYNQYINIMNAWRNACDEWRGWCQEDHGIEFDGISNCCCSQDIYYRCPLFHDRKNIILLIGNECIYKHPFNEATKRASFAYQKINPDNKPKTSNKYTFNERDLEIQIDKDKMIILKEQYEISKTTRIIETIIHHGTFDVQCLYCQNTTLERVGNRWSCKQGCWHIAYKRDHTYNWPILKSITNKILV